MTARDRDFAARRAAIAKVTWFVQKGRLGFRGVLGGQEREVLGDDTTAETKTRLVDQVIAMDAESDG